MPDCIFEYQPRDISPYKQLTARIEPRFLALKQVKKEPASEKRPRDGSSFAPSPFNLSLIPITRKGTHICISRDRGRYYLERCVFWEPPAGSNATLTRSTTLLRSSKEKKEEKEGEWKLGSKYFSCINEVIE
jgi:hypothetical protein